jgi:hypothetical protein
MVTGVTFCFGRDLTPLRFRFKHSGSPHARTNAHGHNTITAFTTVQLMKQRGNLTGTRAAQWVAHRDRAAVWVHLGFGNAQLSHTVHSLIVETTETSCGAIESARTLHT